MQKCFIGTPPSLCVSLPTRMNGSNKPRAEGALHKACHPEAGSGDVMSSLPTASREADFEPIRSRAGGMAILLAVLSSQLLGIVLIVPVHGPIWPNQPNALGLGRIHVLCKCLLSSSNVSCTGLARSCLKMISRTSATIH